MELEKTGFFEEKAGQRSHMRLMSFLVFWLLVAIDVFIFRFSYYADKTWDNYFLWFTIIVNFLFLITIFYPKYLQKILELGISKSQQIKESVSRVMPAGSLDLPTAPAQKAEEIKN